MYIIITKFNISINENVYLYKERAYHKSMSSDINIKSLKTISFISSNNNKFIFNNMCHTSKNIYNSCIFTNNIMFLFKNTVYKKLYNLFNTINVIIRAIKGNIIILSIGSEPLPS